MMHKLQKSLCYYKIQRNPAITSKVTTKRAEDKACLCMFERGVARVKIVKSVDFFSQVTLKSLTLRSVNIAILNS